MDYTDAERLAEQYAEMALGFLEQESDDIRENWERVWFDNAYDQLGLEISMNWPLSNRIHDLFMNYWMIARIAARADEDKLYTLPHDVEDLSDIQGAIGF